MGDNADEGRGTDAVPGKRHGGALVVPVIFTSNLSIGCCLTQPFITKTYL